MPPPDWYEPLILPGILTLAGGLTWFLGWNASRGGRRSLWAWSALIWFGVAIWIGIQYVLDLNDLFYLRSLGTSRKAVWAHYAALIIPAASLVAFLLWQLVASRVMGRKTA